MIFGQREVATLNAGVVPQTLSKGAEATVWTPARLFFLVAAAWHIPLGLAGFVYERSFPVGPAAAEAAGSAHIFGIFETNGWHNLAALALGVLALYFTIKPRGAREAALAVGLFHVGLVLALTVWEPSTFWIASNGADQVIHSATGLGGIVTALVTPQDG